MSIISGILGFILSSINSLACFPVNLILFDISVCARKVSFKSGERLNSLKPKLSVAKAGTNILVSPTIAKLFLSNSS